MDAAIVIPARYPSQRFPGKPLQPLVGADGQAKSLIQRTWEAASRVSGVSTVVVATDDDRIAEAVQAFGGTVAMTPDTCVNGTERCAAALEQLPAGTEIVVNFQGDAPLTPPWFVEELLAAMKAPDQPDMATPVLRCDADSLAHFREDRAAGRVGATTAVMDRAGRALYFSKEVIPFTGRRLTEADDIPVFHHVGLYAYRREALVAYAAREAGPLEQWEGLEQLRFLEHGLGIACVEVEARGGVFWELNNPEDVPRIESALKAQGIA